MSATTTYDSGAIMHGDYRYLLWRTYAPGLTYSFAGPGANFNSRHLLWVMCNPSTADASYDDPTVRRIRDFTTAAGYSGLSVVNLWGFRSKLPADLVGATDPTGPANWHHVERALWSHFVVVAAWGSLAGVTPDMATAQVRAFLRVARAARGDLVLRCLGTTARGQPRHPLMVRSGQPLVPWQYVGPG